MSGKVKLNLCKMADLTPVSYTHLDDEIVKVHIHTNHPGFVLEEAIKLGEMINLKIDNMKHQHKSIIDGSNEQTSENAEVKTAEVKAEKKTEKPKRCV